MRTRARGGGPKWLGVHPAWWLALLVVPLGLWLGSTLAGALPSATPRMVLSAANLGLAAQAHSPVTVQGADPAGVPAVVVGAPAARQRVWDAVLLGRVAPDVLQKLAQTGWVQLLPNGTTGTVQSTAEQQLADCSDGQNVVPNCQASQSALIATVQLDASGDDPGAPSAVLVPAQDVQVP